MSYYTEVEAAVAAAVRTGRIGQLVAVRAFFQLSADHGHLLGIAAEGVRRASAWFDAPPRAVYAVGGPTLGQVCVLADFRDGQTALLTAATRIADGPPTADVLVIGNHGTLHWDAAANAPADLPAYDAEQLSDGGRKLIAAIERSLVTGASVSTEEGA